MRAVIQRVERASVAVEGSISGKINAGLLILLGVEEHDSTDDVKWLAAKITALRIFGDEQGKMNLNVKSINGGVLVVSQFTLHAKIKKGSRPSFIRAAHPEKAILLYEEFIQELSVLAGIDVESGEFGAMMKVELVNDGPVTLIIDTKNKE